MYVCVDYKTLSIHLARQVGWSFQHKNGCIREEWSGLESYPYPVKEGQRYINLNLGHLSVQQPPKKKKVLRG